VDRTRPATSTGGPNCTRASLGLTDPETLAYGPQFPEERRRTYAVETPALFASRRDDPEVQETVTGALEDAAEFTPGNVLAFFPSYGEAERYHDRVTVSGPTYLDEPATSAKDLRETFADEDGAVLFTSLWGTLAEGVSFDGDDARTVVVVGVPYPHLDDRMDAVQEAYDAAFESDRDGRGEGDGRRDGDDGAGWRYAVEIPTVRKTRQALGRVIRAPDDYGARILLDGRYTERAEVEMADYAVRGTFPPEERSETLDVDPAKLKFGLLNFFSDLDAYDGDPPTP
jgi:DNA excision repair protein ERCC-2